METIQCDYSTYSTSLDQGEFGSSGFIYGLLENTADDEESSEGSENAGIEKPPMTNIPPPDKFNFVYVAFGLLGVGTLLPWNFFITAHDYWMYKFRNTSDCNCSEPIITPTSLQASFTAYIALSMNIPYVIFLLVSMFFHSKIARQFYVSISLVVILVIFIGITVLVEINTDSWQPTFFSLTLSLIVLMGVFGAILQAASTGISSVLPPRYIHMLVLSQAMGGIVATVSQIVSVLGHCSPIKSAFAYFLSADVLLLATLLVFLGIQRSQFYQFFLHSTQEFKPMKIISSADVKLIVPLSSVIKRIWPYAICIMMTFWVTIGVFPGLAVLVISSNAVNGSIWTGRLFLPLSCFLVFNVGDFCGRLVSGWMPCESHSHRYRLLVLSIVRIGFIPLFMLCNAQPRSANLPVVFGDIAFIILNSALGLTNGCIVTLAMICGTKCVSKDVQEIAGVILSAFLGIGLMLGSIFSYIFVQIL